MPPAGKYKLQRSTTHRIELHICFVPHLSGEGCEILTDSLLLPLLRPGLNSKRQIAVGSLGPQPQVADRSGHYKTSTQNITTKTQHITYNQQNTTTTHKHKYSQKQTNRKYNHKHNQKHTITNTQLQTHKPQAKPQTQNHKHYQKRTPTNTKSLTHNHNRKHTITITITSNIVNTTPRPWQHAPRHGMKTND